MHSVRPLPDGSSAPTARGRVVVVGSANMDLVVGVERFPRPGETVLAGALHRGCGGKGANQAVACARAGGEVAFMGAVGTDADGRAIRTRLRDDGIDDTLVRSSGVPTGLAIVTVARDGENTIVVAAGANAAIELTDADRGRIRSATVVLLQLEIPLAVVGETVALATGLVVLNAAPAQTLPGELLDRVDVLVVNRDEAAALGTAVGRPAAVVTTLGRDGVRIERPGQPVVDLAAHAVDAVDTTAAGDTFCGVLAAELARGADLVAAATRANRAAAITVTRPGAQDSIPTAAEIDG